MENRSNLGARSFSDGIEFSMQGKYSLVLEKERDVVVTKAKRRKLENKRDIWKVLLFILLISPLGFISEIPNIIIYTGIIMLVLIPIWSILIDKNTKEYHAAEHMVINAYDKYNRVPTLDEVKKSSPFSSMSGENNAIFLGINLVLLGICIKFYTKEMLLIVSLMIILNINMYLNSKYNKIQIFMLKKPSDKKLKNAISAFEELVKQIK